VKRVILCVVLLSTKQN